MSDAPTDSLCTNCRTDPATVAGVGGEHICEVCAHALTCEVCVFETPMECSTYRRLMNLSDSVTVMESERADRGATETGDAE